ncbi:CRE-GUR-4 protein [Ditylenchus destructor]|nr:CRE-GUR-4 protein [Ditylenchus destructor]
MNRLAVYKGLEIMTGQIKKLQGGLINLFNVCWVITSVLAIMYVIVWQHSGGFRCIDRLIIPHNELCPKYIRLRHFHRRCCFLLLVFTVFHCTINVLSIALWVMEKSRLNAQIEIYLSRAIFNAIAATHGPFVFNVLLCVFSITVTSITIELEELNTEFRQRLELFGESPRGIQEREKIAQYILATFVKHNSIAGKIITIDKMFRNYAFLMVSLAFATTIFGFLSLIRTESASMFFLFSAYDVASCILHTYGLCILPARGYNEFCEAQHIVNREAAIWSEYDSKLYHVAKMFTDNIVQSSVGITLGGFTLITKSMILTCFSFVVPYVILFLQLHVGSHRGTETAIATNVTTVYHS